MIASHKLRKRDIYLNKLIAFQDTEQIRVVTGIPPLRQIQSAQADGCSFARERCQ